MSIGLKKVPPSVVLFLFFFSIYAITMSGTIRYGDEVEKYRVAQSLVDRHDITFRPTAERDITGTSGRTYSVYELGQTLLEIPLYVLGRVVNSVFPMSDSNFTTMLVVGFFNPIITALTCVLLFETSLTVGFGFQTSLALSVLFGLGTIAWPYSKGFTREPLLALLILLSVYAIQRFRKSNEHGWLLAAGGATGYLVFSKFIQGAVVPVFLVFIAVIIWQGRERIAEDVRSRFVAIIKGLAVFLSPALIFLGLQSIYSFVRFGTMYSGLAGTKVNPIDLALYFFKASTPGLAIAGLTISIEKSVFVYSPAVILFVFAWLMWWRRDKILSLLILTLLAVEFSSSIFRLGWDGGDWWGPRYVVQVTPLLILALGALESPATYRRLWKALLGSLLVIGVMVQLIGSFSSDRDYLDITGKGTFLGGQLDFLRHGALESVVVYLSPQGFPIQVNPFAIVLAVIAVLMGAWMLRKIRHANSENTSSWRVGLALVAIVLIIEFTAFIVWIVAPYPQVLTAQANTKFVAANSFFTDGRLCEARAMYGIAIERGTTFQRQALARLGQLAPLPRGTSVYASDLLDQQEKTGSGFIQVDGTTTITGNGALMASSAKGEDVIARGHANPVPVLPNTLYEVSGWIKTVNVYGAGFGSVTVSEDDGAYRHIHDIDVAIQDETRGWTRFHTTLTTLPTTRRLFVAAGLWKSFGSVWIDGLEIAQITKDNPALADLKPCN